MPGAADDEQWRRCPAEVRIKEAETILASVKAEIKSTEVTIPVRGRPSRYLDARATQQQRDAILNHLLRLARADPVC